MSISAIVLAVLGMFRSKVGKASLKGKGLAILAIILSSHNIFFSLPRVRSVSYRMLCAQNLSNLGKAILIYAGDNNDMFPSAFNWCDLLIRHTDVTEEQFICGDSFLPVFSYGFNKNLHGLRIGDVSPNTVVLFEIKGGRNVSGGPELLINYERHHGDGCNILFNDYHVEFVYRYKLEDLKWDVNETEKNSKIIKNTQR